MKTIISISCYRHHSRFIPVQQKKKRNETEKKNVEENFPMHLNAPPSVPLVPMGSNESAVRFLAIFECSNLALLLFFFCIMFDLNFIF